MLVRDGESDWLQIWTVAPSLDITSKQQQKYSRQLVSFPKHGHI